MYTLKKSLGQHFLKDENICRKIVAALTERSFSHLLEVGPGGGALTKYLIELSDVDFKAVELDTEKVEYFKTQGNVPLTLGFFISHVYHLSFHNSLFTLPIHSSL